MRNILTLAVLVLVSCAQRPYTPTPPPTPSPTQDPYRVVIRILDGDTVELDGGERVRLLGIDAPEVGEACSSEATTHLSLLLGSGRVIVEIGGDQVDKYGRTLAYLFASPGGLEVNYYMVADGYAWAYRRYSTEYVDPEESAQALGLGCLWKPEPTPPPRPPVIPPRPPAPTPTEDCTPGYMPCLPRASDWDCTRAGGGNGPYYVEDLYPGQAIRVTGSDPYRLDGRDNDGWGCE